MVSFIGEGNPINRRKPPTCHKSVGGVKNQISKLLMKVFLLLMLSDHHKVCRSYKCYFPYISWMGKESGYSRNISAERSVEH